MLNRTKSATWPPRPSSQGHRRAAQWAEKRNRKAPSVAGGAWKISVRSIQRTRNLFGSPAQGGLKNEREAHHSSRAIETAHNNPPKTKTNGPQQSCTHRGAAIRLTTRLNGSCLCAISQLGSYMSCRVGRSRAAMALFCEVVGRVSESVTCHREHNSMRGYGGLRLPPSLFELRRTSRLTNPPYVLPCDEPMARRRG